MIIEKPKNTASNFIFVLTSVIRRGAEVASLLFKQVRLRGLNSAWVSRLCLCSPIPACWRFAAGDLQILDEKFYHYFPNE
ncbi:hypothetical protein [Coleofasciculus sp. FACHB-501]|uniref:hypothetical protein n=1 Tax=Coleofasciculus sp. FACHB-501 TaxID=2692786 RepID=UPI001A7E5340|nr:hypothetical protein [Coleofasciculus sp. FACHB-501]